MKTLPFEVNGEDGRWTKDEELLRCVAVNRRRLLLRFLRLLIPVLAGVIGTFFVALTQPPRGQLGTSIARPLVGARQQLWGGELR